MQLDATGRPDESLTVEFVGPLQPGSEDNPQNGKLLSFSLQKGQLKANVCFRPLHSANLEVPLVFLFHGNLIFFFFPLSLWEALYCVQCAYLKAAIV